MGLQVRVKKVASYSFTSDQGSFTFSNIPQTGKHLMIIFCSRGAGGLHYNGLNIRPNGSTGWTWRRAMNQEGTIYAGDSDPLGTGYQPTSIQSANAQATGSFSSNTFIINNYSSTTAIKTMTDEFGIPNPNGVNFRLGHSIHNSPDTSAVTSVEFYAVLNYVAGTTADLYILD